MATRLESKLRHLELRRDDDKKLRYFVFQIGACDDFAATVARVKGAIASRDRRYDEGRRTWTVVYSSVNETRLASIFDNWVEMLEAARLQIWMF